MSLSISTFGVFLTLYCTNLTYSFRINSYPVKIHSVVPWNPSLTGIKPDVKHTTHLGSLFLDTVEFKGIPDILKYEKLTEFMPDSRNLFRDVRKSFSKCSKTTLKVINRLKLVSLSDFKGYYYDLLDELKFLYLKGINFSFSDLFSLGDNPVYLLVKVNLAVFLLDFLLKGGVSKSFSIKGLELFFGNEHYRILTSLFLHSDLRHLLSNLGSLLSVGNSVLKVFGPKNLLIIFFLSGITSNYLSYVYNFVYKNGIPANLLVILRSIGRNFSIASKPVISATNAVVDDILNKTKRLGFPIFLFDHIFTSLKMFLDFCIANLCRFFSGVSPRPPNEVDIRVRDICISKSKSDFKSCGSSGGIFGLYGALLTYYIRTGYISNSSVINNLLVSFVVPYILRTLTDNLDHVSHLVGFIFGSLISPILD